MNQEEIIQWLWENVPELGKTKDEVTANVNALVKTEKGKEKLLKWIEQKQRNMTQHKNGGKVEYLKCLKKGGSIADCGCGKKMPKAATGTQLPEKKERKDANGQAFTEKDGTQVLTRRGSGNYSVSSTRDGEYTAPYRTEKRISYDYMGTPIDSTFIVHNQHVDAPSTTKYRPDPSLLQKLFGWKDYNGQFDNAYKVNFEQSGGNITKQQMFQGGADNKGFNKSQARMAYTNAKNALRRSGMKGADMRNAARRMVAGLSPQAQIIARDYDMPVTTVNSDYTQASIAPATEVQGRLRSQNMTGFGGAFARSRERGLSEFTWNNNRYTTQTAEENPTMFLNDLRNAGIPTEFDINIPTIKLNK